MSGNAFPTGGPPPLPPRPVMPVQPIPAQPFPAQPVSAPPPYSGYAPYGVAPYPQQPAPEYYAPQMPEEPQAGSGNDWMLWAIPIAAVLVLGVGSVLLLALREGPGKATANVPPAAWKAVPAPAPAPAPAPRPLRPTPIVPPVNAAPRNGGGAQGGAPQRVPPVRSTPRPEAPQIALPPARDMDVQLKRMWEIAERNGVATRTIKTLKSGRQGALGTQPVEVSVAGTFPQIVKFMAGVQESLPATLPVSFEMSHTPKDPTDQPAAVPVTMTMKWFFDTESSDGSPASDESTPYELTHRPDFAAALSDLARSASGRLRLLSFSCKPEPAQPTSMRPRAGPVNSKPTGTMTALIRSDVAVGEFIHALNASPRFMDVNLISTDSEPFGDRTVRKMTLEFRLRDEGYARRAPVAGFSPQGIFTNVPDPFQLPPSLQPERAEAAAPAPAAKVDANAEAARAAQHLRLQTVIAGTRSACMINNRLYRVGQVVDGFTIEEITKDAVTLRRGESRVKLTASK